MISDSDDEFGEGESLEYDEAFEAQLRIIEGQVPSHQQDLSTADGFDSTAGLDITADRAPAIRRKLEHLDVSMEDDVADDEAVDNLVGEEEQVVLDVLNAAASQSSKYEDDLVQQVTSLMPGTSEQVSPVPQERLASPAGTSHLLPDGAAEDDDADQGSKRKKSLFEKFRKRGFFSVTDLVSPSWCEVQFDYRLRSKSYLPVAARPDTITTSAGAIISVNKEIAGTGEKIMRKGEEVHKKLEREIHPVEVTVKTESREDVWGLRFLNMLASLEALLTLGKCRELPVVGFIRGHMIVGVIDEITRQPLISYSKKKATSGISQQPKSKKSTGKQAKSSPNAKDTDSASQIKSSPQKTLFAFYRPLRSKVNPPPRISHQRTHMLYVSDSKTRAGGTMPKEENSVSGKMQLMLYKEMLDGMVVEGLRQHAVEQRIKRRAEGESEDEVQIVDMPGDDDVIFVDQSEEAADSEAVAVNPEQSRRSADAPSSTTMDRFRWQDLFDHLSLNPDEPFTETFLEQSRPLIQGNSLSVSVATASTLQDMTSCWAEYVAKLGLGTIDPAQSESQIEEALQKEIGGRRIGRSEKLLTLVYRRIGKTKKKTRGQRSQADESSRKPGRGKRRKREKVSSENDAEINSTAIDLVSPPDVTQSRDVEIENDRLLQLAIAESLVPPASPHASTLTEQETQEDTAARMDEDEPLPASLVPPEVFQAHQQRELSQPVGICDQFHVDVTQKQSQAPDADDSSAKPVEEEDGSIIGSHRFAYSASLLSEHIDRILQFWTGSREPVGVSIENTTRCGWCEFEEGCEWRAAKAVEAANRSSGLQSSRRAPARPPCH